MKGFKDTAGRSWELAVHVGAVKRLRELLDVDLLTIMDRDSDLLHRLQADPVLLVDLLFCLVKPQADAAGVSDEQFGAAMDGQALDAAISALFEELVVFFPSPRRQLLAAARAKTQRLTDLATKLGTDALQETTLERAVRAEAKKLKAELAKAAKTANQQKPPPPKGDGATSGASPAKSASTPRRSPGGSSKR